MIREFYADTFNPSVCSGRDGVAVALMDSPESLLTSGKLNSII